MFLYIFNILLSDITLTFVDIYFFCTLLLPKKFLNFLLVIGVCLWVSTEIYFNGLMWSFITTGASSMKCSIWSIELFNESSSVINTLVNSLLNLSNLQISDIIIVLSKDIIESNTKHNLHLLLNLAGLDAYPILIHFIISL